MSLAHEPEPRNAERHLRRLLEVSGLLARFESAAKTVPLILGAVGKSLPLRSMVLIDGSGERPRNTVWHAPGVEQAEIDAASERATEEFRYLTSQEPGGRLGERSPRSVVVEGMPHVVASDPAELRFVSLPLIVENHPTFGVVQLGVLLVHATGAFDEIDLAFLGAVAHQLAVAIDRDAGFRALVEHERRARGLAEEEAQRATLAQAREVLFGRSTAELSTALSLEPTVSRLADLVVSAIAPGCVVLLDDGTQPQRQLRVVGVATREAAERDRLRQRASALSLDEGHREVLLAAFDDAPGEVWSTHGSSSLEGQRSILDALGVGCAIVVPLRARAELLGGLLVLREDATQGFTSGEVESTRELAWRGAIAIDNALLFDRETRAVRAREDILAIVSHDLRNPLSAVITNLSGALAPAMVHDERSTKMLEGAKRAAEQMRLLVMDLFDFANIERGRLSLEPTPMDARTLVQECLEASELSASRCEVSVSASLPSERLAVLADRSRVRQVFGNLVDNALRFTRSGGSIELSVSPAGDVARFCVADTGAGMSAEILPHIFERYWKGDRAGTGLGLAIVRGIVEAHGGRVWAESEPGEGSRIFFELPRAIDS